MNLNLHLGQNAPESESAEAPAQGTVKPVGAVIRDKSRDQAPQYQLGLKVDKCHSCADYPSAGPRRTGHKRLEYDIINVEALNLFADTTTVTPEALREAGLIKRKNALIKILGDGELEKQLKVQAHRFSKSAIEKIEARDGTTEVLGLHDNTDNTT